MRLRTAEVDIRLAIQEHSLVANWIPLRSAEIVPACEVYDFDSLPMDVIAWINFLERKSAS